MGKASNVGSESETSAPRLAHFTRRSLLESAAAMAPAAILSSGFMGAALSSPMISATQTPAKNPSWYGFNLLEYFSTDADWMKYFPYKNDGMFLEDDFRWTRDWGFNWVRLPMDYRFWTGPDLFAINEKQVEPIDRAVWLGEQYGIHVNICLHRAPGLCILDTEGRSWSPLSSPLLILAPSQYPYFP